MTDSSVLDNIMDVALDDLEDAPSFKPFVPGSHSVSFKQEAKEVGGDPCIEVTFTLIETVEQVNEDEEPSKPGDEASLLFNMTSEWGQGGYKDFMKSLRDGYPSVTTIRESLEECQGVEAVIVTGIRADKKDPDRKYMTLKDMSLL